MNESEADTVKISDIHMCVCVYIIPIDVGPEDRTEPMSFKKFIK